MKRRRGVIVAIFTFIVIGATVFFSSRKPGGPEYQNRSVAYWLEVSGRHQMREPAQIAFREMGAEAVPYILEEERKLYSSFPKRYWDFWAKRSMFQRKFLPNPSLEINDTIRRVSGHVYAALMAVGSPGIPPLIAALEDENIQIRITAVRALFNLQYDYGFDITDSLPIMINLIHEQSLEIKLFAIRNLGGMGKAAESAVPELTQLLEGSQSGKIQLRASVVQAIGEALEKIQTDLNQ